MFISTWFDYTPHDPVNWFEFIFEFTVSIMNFANAVWNVLTSSMHDLMFPLLNSLPSFLGFGFASLLDFLPSGFMALTILHILGGGGLVFIVGMTLIKFLPWL